MAPGDWHAASGATAGRFGPTVSSVGMQTAVSGEKLVRKPVDHGQVWVDHSTNSGMRLWLGEAYCPCFSISLEDTGGEGPPPVAPDAFKGGEITGVIEHSILGISTIQGVNESMLPHFYACPLKFIDTIPHDRFGGHAGHLRLLISLTLQRRSQN